MLGRCLLPLLACVAALCGADERPLVPADTQPQPRVAALPAAYAEAGLDALREPDPRAELGRALFFWPGLSRDRSLACASCHRPELGLADDRARSTGVGGALTLHNAPTLYGRALGQRFMWRGDAATLEEQVLKPVANPLEMDLAVEEAVARVNADAALRAGFEQAFGGPADDARLAQSLAAFVRRLVPGEAPLDRFRAGDHEALTAAERAGMWFFQSRGQCWRCHAGPGFTDEAFHNTGVGVVDGAPEAGRAAVTGDEADRGAFKTPTLRELAHTAPYMHDGSLATLAEVVEFYRRGGTPNAHLDPHVAPIEMSDAEAANLVAFLRALTAR